MGVVREEHNTMIPARAGTWICLPESSVPSVGPLREKKEKFKDL